LTFVIARYVLVECVRRRVFLVVPVATALFLGLYWFGVTRVFDQAPTFGADIDSTEVTGSTMLGLSMFGTFFLGAVLATFLTFTVVRGDAEQGLLQPLIVRPLGRRAFLAGRFIGAAGVGVVYSLFLFLACVAITGAVGGWTPDRVVEPALQLTGAIVFVAAVSTLGSVYLATVANGIAVLMFLGAGMVAGFLGQIGEALSSDTLVSVGRVASAALPFEALYQAALRSLTADLGGAEGFIVRLGPFGGGSDASTGLYAWLAAYFVGIMVFTAWAFERRDV
jgi:ABC-type transport system involved in multi-copper enzyme maturation permease subunit